MLGATWYAPAVTGFHFQYLICDIEPELSGYHKPGLLVGMGVRWNRGSFGDTELAHQCFFAVHQGTQMNTFQKLPLVCGPLFTKHVFNPPVY